METENKVTAIFFPKEKLLDILSKDDKFRLWKEARLRLLAGYSMKLKFYHYHDITTMCHESCISQKAEQEGDGMFVVPRGYGIFVRNVRM